MVNLVYEAKAIAIIFRKSSSGFEILVYKIRDKQEMYYRFPGGGIKIGEDERDALFREIEEEVGFAEEQLTYFRRVGIAKYYKPGIGKMVERHDFLLLYNGNTAPSFSYSVKSHDT